MNEEHLEGDDRREPPQTGATAGSEGDAGEGDEVRLAREALNPHARSTGESRGRGAIRDERGRFQPGTRMGGRPHGSLGFMATVRRFAKREGLDVREMLWKAVKGLAAASEQGDARAASVLLERICGPIPRDPMAVVNVEQNVAVGPPPPSDGELGAYLLGLQRVAASLGLTPSEERPAPTDAQLRPAEGARSAALPPPIVEPPLAARAPRPPMDEERPRRPLVPIVSSRRRPIEPPL